MKKYGFLLLVAFSILACKKAKIEKNLEGSWIVDSFIDDGYNNIDGSTTLKLEFTNVDDNSGKILTRWIEDGDLFIYNGSFDLNDDYTKLVATIETNDPDQDWIWDTNLTVDKEKLTLEGLSSNGEGILTYSFLLKATKE